MIAFGAAYGEIVLQQDLIAVAVGRDHDESLMQVPDRTRVRVAVVLPDAEHGVLDPGPVGPDVQGLARAAASALSASSSAGGPPGRSAVISSDQTVNLARRALP